MGYGFTENIPEIPKPPDPPKDSPASKQPKDEDIKQEAVHWTVFMKDEVDQEEASEIVAITEYVLDCMYPAWPRKFRQYGYDLVDDNRTAHTITLAKLPPKEPEPEEP